MSKWKCEICGTEFKNFHAQGFEGKIYCPLCYFKKENLELRQENQELKKQLANNEIVMTCENCEWFGVCPHSYKEYDYKKECEELKNQQKEFIEWLEKESKELIRDAGYHQRICLDIIEKYKEIIGVKDE